MKKIEKKYWLVFGAVVVAVLMVSGASSAAISQLYLQNFSVAKDQSDISEDYLKEQQSKECEDLVFIAHNTKFSVLYLPMLYRAIREIPIEYLNIHIFLQQLSNTIISKRYADRTDIEQILHELNISTTDIYIGSIYTPDGGSAGSGMCFRRPLGGMHDGLPIIFPSFIRWWATSEHNEYIGVEIYIAGNKITYDHRGWIFGYMGKYESETIIEPGFVVNSWLYFNGLAPLIWVRRTI